MAWLAAWVAILAVCGALLPCCAAGSDASIDGSPHQQLSEFPAMSPSGAMQKWSGESSQLLTIAAACSSVAARASIA